MPHRHENGPAVHNPIKQNEPVAKDWPPPVATDQDQPFRNGAAKGHDDKTPVTEDRPIRVFPPWVSGPNVRFTIGMLIGCGALYWLPATRGQLDALRNEVVAKWMGYDSQLSEIKATAVRADTKLDQVLIRLTPPIAAPPPPATTPTPASNQAPKKAAPKKQAPKRWPIF